MEGSAIVAHDASQERNVEAESTLIQSSVLGAVPGIVHGFTIRQGGVSTGPHASLDVGSREVDQRKAVGENRERVLAALDRRDAVWIALRQVHGADVVQVTALAGRNIEADGLWTRDRRAVLSVLVADCVPILIADRHGEAVAAVHAGWRGTRSKIAAAMVDRLAAAGLKKEDLRVAIGPAIGPCCFEIGADVAEPLREAFPDCGDAIATDPDGRLVADLWTLNHHTLLSAGIKEESIDVLRQCTCCSPELLFSHRRDKGQTGRQAGVIGLR